MPENPIDESIILKEDSDKIEDLLHHSMAVAERVLLRANGTDNAPPEQINRTAQALLAIAFSLK